MCFFCLPPPPSVSSFWTTLTRLSPLCSTRHPCTPILNCLCPISPPTFLRHPRPCPPSGPPKKTSSALLISLCVRYHRCEAAHFFASRKVFAHACIWKRFPLPPPITSPSISVLIFLILIVRRYRLECTYLTVVLASLRPGEEKVLASQPHAFCYLSPLPLTSTFPPAPLFCLPPLQNLLNLSSAPPLSLFLLCGLGFQTKFLCLPVGRRHSLNFNRCPSPPLSPPPAFLS